MQLRTSSTLTTRPRTGLVSSPVHGRNDWPSCRPLPPLTTSSLRRLCQLRGQGFPPVPCRRDPTPAPRWRRGSCSCLTSPAAAPAPSGRADIRHRRLAAPPQTRPGTVFIFTVTCEVRPALYSRYIRRGELTDGQTTGPRGTMSSRT